MQDIYKHSARRLSSASSISSACSWASHEEEASSPTTSRRSSLRFFTYSRRDHNPSTPSTSSRTCEGMTTQDTRELWRCMLELQQLYGCYNSTRMDLAVNAGEAGIDLMPNPFIIDTLNDSLIDLPTEGREMLDRCLRSSRPPHSVSVQSKSKSKSQRKFWARS